MLFVRVHNLNTEKKRKTTMTKSPLIDVGALSALVRDKNADILVCDCRFDLGNVDAGKQAYAQGHIPGAVYLHLDQNLSAPKTGSNGRHPLPEREDFARCMAGLGVSDSTLIVCYDAGDAMTAARLWWMMRWLGHEKVVVLDGGLQAWKEAGNDVSTADPVAAAPGNLTPKKPLVSVVNYEQVLADLKTHEYVVVDARSADRFRGENEAIDPVGGHIPGARNRFFKDNIAANGRFKPAEQLRAEFDAVLQGQPSERVINQCGSGVTACHNLLAMELAGLHGAALYPGSWSEWCAQAAAPVATGAE